MRSKGSIIWNHTNIGDNTKITDSVIADNIRIDDDTTITHGTKICSNTEFK